MLCIMILIHNLEYKVQAPQIRLNARNLSFDFPLLFSIGWLGGMYRKVDNLKDQLDTFWGVRGHPPPPPLLPMIIQAKL